MCLFWMIQYQVISRSSWVELKALVLNTQVFLILCLNNFSKEEMYNYSCIRFQICKCPGLSNRKSVFPIYRNHKILQTYGLFSQCMANNKYVHLTLNINIYGNLFSLRTNFNHPISFVCFRPGPPILWSAPWRALVPGDTLAARGRASPAAV